MEPPRTDHAPAAPSSTGTSDAAPDPAAQPDAPRAEGDEQTTQQHWSPFAPPRESEPTTPPNGHHVVSPPTQQHPAVPAENPYPQQSAPYQGQPYQPAAQWTPEQPPQWPQPPQAEPPAPPAPPMPSPPTSPAPNAPQSPIAPESAQPYLPVPYSDQMGTMDSPAVTADDFARRRTVVPTKPVANSGARAALRKSTFGLLSLGPNRREQEIARSTDAVRRNFGGLRQITVVNPKGGAGKTVAVLMLAMMFGQRRGGYVLAWDNNETQGTLGMRSQQDFHTRTVRDLLRDLDHFQGPTGRVGDLSQYVRAQGEAMFDVLASDESATAGEMLTSQAFGDIREVVSRFYKLIVVDTGNNVRAANWQSAIDATDQLVVTMSARNDSAETAARMLDHLEQSGRRELVREAVSVVSMPAHRKDLDLPAVQRHFAARTRAVLLAPYEKLLDSGEPIRYSLLSQATRNAWLKIAASVSEGL